jgi:hypothetical protein
MLLALVVLAGCRAASPWPRPPVVIPDAAEIDALEVTLVRDNTEDPSSSYRVVDRSRIERFVDVIQHINAESANRKFERQWYTYPFGEYTVVAERRGQCVAVFYPGVSTYLMGRSPADAEKFLQPASDEELMELAAILDIPQSAISR